MRGRILLFVLLGSALTFLASLFMVWRERALGITIGQGPFTLSRDGNYYGWVTGTGDVAVLLVVALVLAALAALRRPQLAARLPIGSLGVGLGYFAAAVALEVHTMTATSVGGFTGFLGHPQAPHTSWAYGFYVGLASGAVAAIAGLVWTAGKLRRPKGALDTAAVGFALALLISFLLPWIGESGLHGLNPSSYPGILHASAIIAALGLLLGAPRLHGETRQPWRLPFAIGTAILTGGAASVDWHFGIARYGLWIAIGCAALLVAVETVRAWPFRLPLVPRGLTALRVGASALLVVSLFLPWEGFRGETISPDGWYSVFGAAAGSLCLLLAATPWLPAFESYVLDAVVAVVLLVSALIAGVRAEPFVLTPAYGAYVGIAAAVMLLVSALVPVRTGRLEPGRALPRTLPLVASVLCVVVIVLPWWFVVPRLSLFQDSPLYGWLDVPGMLLALYLVRLWRLRMRGPAAPGLQLVLVPLVLLVLAALELIRFRASVIWTSVILVGLCLLLIVFGWLERTDRLESFRVPEEIWRIDRLPEPDG